MLIAVDVGGTKTLASLVDRHQNIIHEVKIPTNPEYSVFIKELHSVIEEIRRSQSEQQSASIAGIAIALPGRVNRSTGTGISFGNLPWINVPVVRDLQKLGLDLEVIIENDANLAGLAEAQEHPNSRSIAYLTISTGIGSGYVYNGRLNPTLLDAEAGQMLVPDPSAKEFVPWEKVASGKFISEHFHKMASEIRDPKIWHEVAHRLVPGFSAVIVNVQPDVIVVGGGAGQALANFKPELLRLLKRSLHPMITIPEIVVAEHPEKAVLYGCYYLGMQKWRI